MIRVDWRELTVGLAEAPLEGGWPPTRLPSAGWGRCRACDCQGFKDTGEDFRICAGCGHNWTEHR